jgi:hypothetical protein
MSKGKVVAINERRGMFVVQDSDGGDFLVFELLDGVDLELGAQVSGDLDFLGSGEIYYAPEGRAINVFGQSGATTRAHAVQLIA